MMCKNLSVCEISPRTHL